MARRSAVGRRPMGKDPALAPERTETPTRRTTACRRPQVLQGILWIECSGTRRCDLPEECPSPSTCWRRLRDWEEQEVWLEIWRAFLNELNERQR